MPTGSRTPGAPTSLVQPEAATAAARRAVASAVAANNAPTADTPGFPVRGHRWLHVEVKVTGGTSVDWRLWTRRGGMSDEWMVDTRLGSAPGYAETVTTAGAENPNWSIVEVDGADRVYVELLNFAGGETVDVWLGSTSGPQGR